MECQELSERFLAAQLRGDRRGGLRVIMEDGLARGISIPDLHQHVIRRAQLEIGRLWESNSITVAREHVATAIAHLALAQLYPHLPRAEPSGHRVVLACVDGEHHDLAARIVCDFLEMAGLDVLFLGADNPPDELITAVREHEAHALALSVTVTYHLDALEEAVECARAEFGRDFPIYAGGRALEARDQAWAHAIGLTGIGRAPDETSLVLVRDLKPLNGAKGAVT